MTITVGLFGDGFIQVNSHIIRQIENGFMQVGSHYSWIDRMASCRSIAITVGQIGGGIIQVDSH